MSAPKTERNKLILKLLAKGWSFGKVAKEMGFKSKGTVWEIYKRETERTEKKSELSTV